MSGGSFDYAYRHAHLFAEELDARIASGMQEEFWPETLAKLREIVALARYTAKMMREAEWLYSGDTSDESFLERVGEIGTYRARPDMDALACDLDLCDE